MFKFLEGGMVEITASYPAGVIGTTLENLRAAAALSLIHIFSHKGKVIAIENQNSWTDGGVASPIPFYWSTNGYGMMWYTFKKGEYDLSLIHI